MGLISKLLGGPPRLNEFDEDSHAVIVRFRYGSTDLSPLYQLEYELKSAIDAARAGEYDGHEIEADGSEGYLYMYGPDADHLFEAVRPTMQASSLLSGAVATVRYGPPDDESPEREIKIGD